MAGDHTHYLLPGTLDLLVLKALHGQRLHALGIARRIQEMTGGVFEVKQGSLRPCLKRLGDEQIVNMRRGTSPKTGKTLLLYCHGKGGGSRLRAEMREWKTVSKAINKAVGNGLGE
jgi:PadR family transcriptional regulator, regulatory protein PadR